MHGLCKKGSAALREVFNAEGFEDAKECSTAVTQRLDPTAPKVAALLDAAEEDPLAVYRLRGRTGEAALDQQLRARKPGDRPAL